MTDLNIFFNEWKAFTAHQKEILQRLEDYNEEINAKLAKKTYYLLGGLLMGVLIIGMLLGYLINTHVQVKSVPYAVSTDRGCSAMGGSWAVQKNGEAYCFFQGF